MNEDKFCGKSAVYSAARPNYPKAFIDYLYTDIIFENACVADIGSGTGIFTKQLLEKGSKVYAIEPNSDMRFVSQNELEAFALFTSLSGNAEKIPLPDNSVDFVSAAQSFHWFEREKFKSECRRILKENGKVILVWNCRDEKSEIVNEIDLINRKYCKNYAGFSGGLKIEKESFTEFFKGDFISKAFRNDILFSKESFINRNLSSSFSPKESDESFIPYIEALKKTAEKHEKNGDVILPNITKCFIGKV